MNVQEVNEHEIREMNEEQSESKWTTDQKYMNIEQPSEQPPRYKWSAQKWKCK